MEKLMKPAEYAQELGISRQAVYAKIKRGILASKSVEGKLYIVVDNVVQKETPQSPKVTTAKPSESASKKDYKALLQAKDETISVLKETVVDLKESNKQISTTLRGEIDLLKDAFHEMRTLYVHQLEYKKQEQIEKDIEKDIEKEACKEEEEVIEIFTHEEELDAKWIGVKKFLKTNKVTKEKQTMKVIKRLKKAYKNGDKRFMKVEGKLKLNANKNYKDILN